MADTIALTATGPIVDIYDRLDNIDGLGLPKRLNDIDNLKIDDRLKVLEKYGIYKTLTDLKKAEASVDRPYTLLTAFGRVEYSYLPGNYTSRVNDSDVVILDNVPVTTGALVHQGARQIITRNSGESVSQNVEEVLRQVIHIDNYKYPNETYYDEAIRRAVKYLKEVGGGTLRFGRKIHRCMKLIDFDTGSNEISLVFEGEGLGSVIDQYGAGQPVIRIGETQRMRNSAIVNLRLRSFADAGAVIEIGKQGFEWLKLDRVDLEQYNQNQRCWLAPHGNMFYLDATGYWRAAVGAKVSPVYIRAQDTSVNHNKIDITGYNSGAAPFFDIANEATATWLVDNKIHAVLQNCPGGAIVFSNALAWDCKFNMWDLTSSPSYTGHIVRSSPNAGYESAYTRVSIKRHGAGMSAAFRDVKLDEGQDFFVECITHSSDNPIYDWGNRRVKVAGRAYNELNFNQRERDQVEQKILISLLTQNFNTDVMRIGGLTAPERATLSGVSGFVEMATTVPGTGISLSVLTSASATSKLIFSPAGTSLYPLSDGIVSLGLAGSRYDVIYAATSSINTSDARQKDWRGSLTENELNAAKEISRSIGVFRFNNAIDLKGDKARLHIGVKAQEVVEILTKYNLDPFSYGFVCHDKWEPSAAVVEPGSPPILDNNGKEVRPEIPEKTIIPAIEGGEQYGIRYEELSMFLIAAQEQRLAQLEVLL